MANNRRCRLCREPVPQVTIYRLNKIAVREGFCSWGCLIGGMDSTTVVALLKAEREKAKENQMARGKR